MSQLIRQHIIAATLALIVFFTALPFAESVINLHYKAQSAIEWENVKILNDVVYPGDIIEVVYKAKVNKLCPADLRGFIVAPDGTVPIRYPIVAGGYTKPTEEPTEIKVKVVMPLTSDPGLAPLVSGEYAYRAIATRYCPEGIEEDTDVPEAKFKLVLK